MKSTKYIKMAFFVLVSLLLVSYSYAGNPKAPPFLPDIPKTWTQITPEPTTFMGRDLVPTCSGAPGTNTQFSFFVKGGTVNNLVVYFEGGGACWHSMNCLYARTYTQEVDVTTQDLNQANGIFDTTNPANPFKDWSFVAIPYCTGDIHWGSSDYPYPYGPGSYTIHHRGFDNFLVVLQWITKNFREPHSIFVTGSSAGAYGAILGFPYIQEAYPKAKVSIVGDAGNGVITEDFHTGYINNWNIQPNMPEWIPGFERPFSEYTIADVYKMIADYYPHRKLGQYTTEWDWNQTFFYNVMLNITDPSKWGNWPLVWCDWHAQMLSFVYDAAMAPNYRYYIGPGTDHTIMGSPKFYTEESDGILLVDGIAAMVGNQGGTNGHGGILWVNVDCLDCGDPVPCP